ncbi:hypothetical protein N7513_001772 [Penicillium frequentans]|uniref:Uncharacterized protein n=1 Tax=Penicillium frequentans TaxID=3151616 RepID=A0AAD6D670_9EURO|nr:hypothetical protein N7494_000572 [Penicillium glabrum]KAJ5559373.1 hypothetical protein N7513_001772 [Penicillium glabrum]
MEAQEGCISGRPAKLLSNSDALNHLQNILLWVDIKEKSTQHHIRHIEGLIGDFARIQLDEKHQVTLNDMWIET